MPVPCLLPVPTSPWFALFAAGVIRDRVIPSPCVSPRGMQYPHSPTWKAVSSWCPLMRLASILPVCKKAGLGSDSGGSSVSLFSPNKWTFPLLVLPKIPSEGFFLEENPLFLVGKACRVPVLGRPQGRLCSLLFLFWAV